MELQERITALESENAQYKAMLENTNAEKMALDMAYVNSLKDSIAARKDVILTNTKLQLAENRIHGFIGEISDLKKQLADLSPKEEIKDEAPPASE